MSGIGRFLLLSSFCLGISTACRTPRDKVELLRPDATPTRDIDNPDSASMRSKFKINKLDPKPASYDRIKITLRQLKGKDCVPSSPESHDNYEIDTLLGLTPNFWYAAEIDVYSKGKLVAENRTCCRVLSFKADFGEISKSGKLCPFVAGKSKETCPPPQSGISSCS